MSRRVDPSEQGKLQGAASAVQAITGMVGPALFTQAFAQAIRPGAGLHLPGMPFLLAAAMLVAAGALAWLVTRGHEASRASP